MADLRFLNLKIHLSARNQISETLKRPTHGPIPITRGAPDIEFWTGPDFCDCLYCRLPGAYNNCSQTQTQDGCPRNMKLHAVAFNHNSVRSFVRWAYHSHDVATQMTFGNVVMSSADFPALSMLPKVFLTSSSQSILGRPLSRVPLICPSRTSRSSVSWRLLI